MAILSALLANKLRLKAEINFYTMQEIALSVKYEANQEKLETQKNYEEKYNKAFEDAQDADKTCKIGNKTYKEKDQVLSDKDADHYACLKVPKYDPEELARCYDLDLDYDNRKTTLEALLESLKAQDQAMGSTLQQAAQDTGLIQT